MKPLLTLLLLCGLPVTLIAQTARGTVPMSGSVSTLTAIPETPSPPSKKSIEPLSDEESKQLSEARAKLEAAQKELTAIEINIRHAHGQFYQLCAFTETQVTLWGDYALVDTHSTGGCVSW